MILRTASLLGFGLAAAAPAIAACPAQPEQALWQHAACEISGDSPEFDESTGRVRQQLGVATLNAVAGTAAMTLFAPLVAVPEFDTDNKAAYEIRILLRRAGIGELTPQEEVRIHDLSVASMMYEAGTGPRAMIFWLDEVVRMRGQRLLFVDWGGPAHGVAVVSPELFCRWVNVRLDATVSFVETWDDAMGTGLSETVDWIDSPRGDCMKAAT